MAGTETTPPKTNLLPDGAVSAPGEGDDSMNSRLLKGSVAVLAATAIALGATGCGGGKPSKDAVKAGVAKSYKDNGGGITDDNLINSYAGCIVEETYDSLDDSALQKLADGKVNLNGKVTEEGFESVYKVREKCSTNLTKEK